MATHNSSFQSLDLSDSSTDDSLRPLKPSTSGSRPLIIFIVGIVILCVFIAVAVGVSFGVSEPSPASSPSSSGSGNTVYVVGSVEAAGSRRRGNAVLLDLVTVEGSQESVVTDSSGKFAIHAPVNNSIFTLKFTRSGYAPQMGTGKVTGARSYSLPIVMTPVGSEVDFTPSLGLNYTTSLSMSIAKIFIPPGAVSQSLTKATLKFTVVSPADGPGTLESSTVGSYGSSNLQSAGMFYMEVVDPSGNELTMDPPAQVSFLPQLDSNSSNITAGSMMGWSLDANGQWGNPTNVAKTRRELDSRTMEARKAGYWNCDRNYRTVCARGRVKTSSGSLCPGARVKADTWGAPSFVNADSSGNFCVEGPEGGYASVYVGTSFALTYSFNHNPGTCSNPSSCDNIGDISTLSSECPPDPPTTTQSSYTGGNSQYCSSYSSTATNYANSYGSYSGTIYLCCLGFTVTYYGVSYSCQMGIYLPSSVFSSCASYASLLNTYISSYSIPNYSAYYYTSSGCSGSGSTTAAATTTTSSTTKSTSTTTTIGSSSSTSPGSSTSSTSKSSSSSTTKITTTIATSSTTDYCRTLYDSVQQSLSALSLGTTVQCCVGLKITATGVDCKFPLLAIPTSVYSSCTTFVTALSSEGYYLATGCSAA